MTKQYLLGIDIGTSACKVALFGKDGKVEAAVSEGYPNNRWHFCHNTKFVKLFYLFIVKI